MCRMDNLAISNYCSVVVKQITKERACRRGIGKESLVESGKHAFVRNPEFLGYILIIFALVII